MKGRIEMLLEQGIQAAQAGERQRARDSFIRVVALDQYNEKAWLWLSSIAEATGDKIVCMENILFINPDNTYAAASLQHLRRQPMAAAASSSTLPRLVSPQVSDEWEEDDVVSVPEISPPPAHRVCPICGFHNPDWAYLCDRCGVDLRRLDLHGVLGSVSKPRGRSFTTLLEAWGGAFTFNRLLAFLPEIELASLQRSLAALVMAALLVSAWRAIMTAVLLLLVGGGGADVRIGAAAFRCAAETLPLALLLTLACVPTVLLTWVGARLVGGRQNFDAHAHLTIVAFSIWVVLIALLASLFTFVLYLLGDESLFDLLLEPTLAFIGVVAGLVGGVWLTQALQTAHHLPALRAILATLLAVVLGIIFLLGLNLFAGEWFAELVDMLTPFLLPGTG